MHVLITINAAWNALNFRRPIIDALLERGDRVTLLAPSDASVPHLKSLGVEHVNLEMDTKGLNPVSGIQLTRRLHAHFRDLNPDIVLSYTIKNNIFGAFAAHRLDIPFIPNVSGLGTAFLSGSILQTIARLLYRRAFKPVRTVFFQNSEDLDLFLSLRLVSPTQARLLPGSGIDLDRFTPLPMPRSPPTFLMIGRLLRDKGTFEFVEAARLLRSEHPTARFQLLGAVDAQNRTAVPADVVTGWQDEGVIDYLGTTDDVRPFIAKASAVVLPSYREGAPRTLMEASAMARPVIATDVPGCRSVVERNVTGIFCAAKSAQSLATAFRQFLAMTNEQQTRMGAAGRRKMVDEYDQRYVVSSYMDEIARNT
ncbi:glycosyltransferase family 4 protein [Sulfitobacter sp. JB4-11]|uniref:glycosyltransferase family 4 protein n=1 Tax=Sulfitobacter rhodophyticola TaxID=3238304 RepID=UPI0035157576